ncbi:flagellar protein FliS [Sansalvadorimonas sp. 2012CJ34-2]|uniref:Flagellar protein FliS n=1 Tax=Parendozoicomonas callyspongiae TaxID=2942213 RepID=A0ABT0PEY4_9GAMM|nr:flagellar protein FliS [Sansalvadorimonas sp. 2012CJ34-2]MCL6269561.1 flagellar protein FliS [Sansalvadorimonas sp. 2012CJ34-2]
MNSLNQARNRYRHQQYLMASESDQQVERLVLLLKGLDEILCCCEGAVEAGDLARKGELVGQGMDIFITLKQGLVSESSEGASVQPVLAMSSRLNKLYDHCLFLLSRTTLGNDLEALAAVRSVVQQLIEAWSESMVASS